MAKKTITKVAVPKVVSTSEHIRIAPLHLPKAALSMDELGQNKEDSDLFGSKPLKAAPPPKLVYNNGPLISNAKVYTIFWGKNWKGTPAFITLRNNINNFFKAILVSPLIDQLIEYNTPVYKIGHGSLKGTKVITAGAPSSVITDAAIQTQVKKWLAAHTIPAWDKNTLYFIYTDKGVSIHMGGGGSCTAFCGYHNHIGGKNYYAVMPFPGCAGCLGGLSVFNALTGTSSHELCEAITDAVPGTGWYDNAHGEIGDICPWIFKTVSGFNVQKEWSNKMSACV
jgi:hypothetical protein